MTSKPKTTIENKGLLKDYNYDYEIERFYFEVLKKKPTWLLKLQ